MGSQGRLSCPKQNCCILSVQKCSRRKGKTPAASLLAVAKNLTKKNSALDSCPRPRKYSRPNHERKNKTLRSRSVVSGEVLKWPVHPELATIDALKTRLLLRRSRTFWKTSRQASSRTSRLSWLTLSPKVRALALSSSVVASPGAILPLRGLAALVLLVLSDPRSRALDQPAWVVLAFQNFGGNFHFSLFNR